MDRALIEHKLESLRRCLQRVQDHCPPTVAELTRDVDAQDIITLNLTRAVQRCVDLAAHVLADSASAAPQSMAESFTRLAAADVIDAELAERLRRAVGFRNVAVHSYRAIDWHVVHAIAQTHLHDFSAFARQVQGHALRGAARE
ncbi:MAG: type VII toxin-antitoxin system HepT family RNase toxin [Metallibacterium sp.]